MAALTGQQVSSISKKVSQLHIVISGNLWPVSRLVSNNFWDSSAENAFGELKNFLPVNPYFLVDIQECLVVSEKTYWNLVIDTKINLWMFFFIN